MYLVDAGVRIGVEIGPKNVLQFLLQKNTAAIRLVSLNEYPMLDDVRRKFIIGADQALSVIERCLKIAVSTRNYNGSQHEYGEKVVGPYRVVERLYYELSEKNQAPDQSQIDMAITMLQSVLTTKNVPGEIRQRKLGALLENKILKL